MKVAMVILKLLFLGALFIISNHELHLNNSSERAEFFNLYSGWFENLVDQGLQVTSYVVKFEWLPESNESYGKE
ncbi:MAG: hypothetical protein Q7S27_03170 [Nanoarchaeota archaeon]|nr:hypothetical protein [Nanoarchaeota archaeon]